MPGNKTFIAPSRAGVVRPSSPGVEWCRKALIFWLPLLYFLVADAFYLRTYDSAQIKITLVQMGGVALAILWLSLLAQEGWKAFDREDLVTLSPFLAYLAVVLASFLHAPYKGPSVDDLIRYAFYMFVALIVIRELDQNGVKRLTTVLLWTTAIASLYGNLQWADSRFFPGGIGNGLDPFVWRGAFGLRVFSTFGNPNFFADFLVLIFPVLIAQHLKSRSPGTLLLMGSALWNLYFTETKGAWIGFAVMLSFFVVVYSLFFIGGDLRRVLRRAIAVVCVIVVLFGGLVGYYTLKRESSVGFRVFTWLSTWEMIETHPWIGTGVGSFKVIYPTYRRPEIFHIEGKHNTETDHAEDEYLEQWFDNGIAGFGVFLWLVVSTLFIGLTALSQLTSNLAEKGGRPPPRAYDLLGYLLAFIGMLAHNSFDVSLRFVSSGVFLGLLPGLVVNLSRGYPLWWLKAKRSAPPPAQAQAAPGRRARVLGWLAWPLRLAAWAAWGVLIYKMTREFAELQGPFSQFAYGGEQLQWAIAWTAFFALSLGWAFTLARSALLGTPLVALLVLGSVFPEYYLWGYFKADIHHNIAIFYSKNQQWGKALENYRIVTELNPYFIMPYYFMGNVFGDRFNMKPEYHPDWGDKDGIARTDFDRAVEAYAHVRALAPNYVQMHHQVGVLYLKRGEYAASAEGRPDEREKWWDKALVRFKLYHNLDPVFAPNYYRMAQIYLARHDYDPAIAVYKEYIDAPLCYGHKGLEAQHFAGQHDQDPEAWTNLANAYFLKGDVSAAKVAYEKALRLNAGYEPARRNLGALLQRGGMKRG